MVPVRQTYSVQVYVGRAVTGRNGVSKAYEAVSPRDAALQALLDRELMNQFGGRSNAGEVGIIVDSPNKVRVHHMPSRADREVVMSTTARWEEPPILRWFD